MRLSAAKWSELVSAWDASGHGARAFAEAHGVSEASLRWWKGELARRALQEPARRSPGPGRKRGGNVALARVVRRTEGSSPSIEPEPVRLMVAVGDARIVVSPDFDAPLLRAVVRAL